MCKMNVLILDWMRAFGDRMRLYLLLRNSGASMHDAQYALGYRSPHHPVPAIRSYWEWGKDLCSDETVIYFVHYGPYSVE